MELTIDADVRPDIENADVFGWIEDIVARENARPYLPVRQVREVDYDADSSSSSSSSDHEDVGRETLDQSGSDAPPILWHNGELLLDLNADIAPDQLVPMLENFLANHPYDPDYIDSDSRTDSEESDDTLTSGEHTVHSDADPSDSHETLSLIHI